MSTIQPVSALFFVSLPVSPRGSAKVGRLAGSSISRRERMAVQPDFIFEEPWEPTPHSDFLKEQIEAELTPPHPLYGKIVKPLAIRADSDDVLVQTSDGYALVHLSWCRRSNPSPDFPHALILADWESFLERVYEPDLAAWLEDNPSDEWDALIKEAAQGNLQ